MRGGAGEVLPRFRGVTAPRPRGARGAEAPMGRGLDEHRADDIWGCFTIDSVGQIRSPAEHGSSLIKRAANSISANSLISKVKAAFARLSLVPAVA